MNLSLILLFVTLVVLPSNNLQSAEYVFVNNDRNLKILNELQMNRDITNVQLAQTLEISPPSCLRRVKSLEEKNLILGYNAIVNPELLGFKVTVFAYVGLESQAENDLKTFENYISNFPEVRECHMLVGEVDFLLKIVAKDWDDFQCF